MPLRAHSQNAIHHRCGFLRGLWCGAQNFENEAVASISGGVEGVVRDRSRSWLVRSVEPKGRGQDRSVAMTNKLDTESVPSGALVLVATPIGNLGDLSPRAVEVLRDADVIACEDTRRTRALLTHSGISAGRRLRAVHAHNEAEAAGRIVKEVKSGLRVAYASDAGMPGISDPGARLVTACIEADIPVEIVPGPSAVLAALVLSGLPSDRFVFEGFLSRRGAERRRQLESIAVERRTVVCFESPRRMAATLADLANACGDGRRAAVVREVTKLYEEVQRSSLGELAANCTEVPRGEHVIVIGGAPPAADPDDATIEEAVAAALADGASARDASVAVAKELGVARRRAYEIANRLTGVKAP